MTLCNWSSLIVMVEERIEECRILMKDRRKQSTM